LDERTYGNERSVMLKIMDIMSIRQYDHTKT